MQQPASAAAQSSSTATGRGTAVGSAAESPRVGQAKAADSLAGGGTQLGKRQLPEPLATGSPAQRRELSTYSGGVPMDAEPEVAHDAGSAASKQAAASKWEADMINWSI